jgi:hypothetical protein
MSLPQPAGRYRIREVVSSVKSDETIAPPAKPFSLRREDSLKPIPGINAPDQTTRFDHVGYHHQADLPPLLQEVPGRSAKAAGAQSDVGLVTADRTLFEPPLTGRE